MEYNFRDIEKRWQDEWRKNKTYHVVNGGDKPKFYVLDMFPYPSGAGLHVGHPLGYIASDIVARYKRLCGYNVLHPMGYDAFGLPAEQYAIQTGRHPADTTKENIARYREQLDKIGFSFDWDREVQTCDPKYYKWTQWIFIQLFKSWYNHKTDRAESMDTLIAVFEKEGFRGDDHRTLTGDVEQDVKPFTAEQWKNFSEKEKSDVLMNFRLAYLGEAWVNWCPQLGTVLANDEVKDGVSERGGYPVERKRMPQWSMRITAYADRLLKDLDTLDWSESIKEAQRNWIGRSEGTSIQFAVHSSQFTVEVFTTRPDTIFGVTFVTLAPEHELVDKITTAEYKSAVDAYVNVAKNKSERERQAEKKVSGQFTGAYVIHPFTNEKIPVYIGEYVLAGYGTGAVMAVPAHDSRDHAFAKHFGLPIPQVVAPPALGSARSDKDVAIEVDVQVESYDAKEGKCINSDFLNGLEVKDAVRRAIEEIEKRGIGKGKVNFRLRDAAFGRQRYWGEPIPVYYKDGVPMTMDERDLPLVLPEIDKFLPTDSGEPPLARAKNWFYSPDAARAGALSFGEQGEARGGSSEKYPLETTTMPGWAGSSWYFLRYMVPDVKHLRPKDDHDLVGWNDVDYWRNVDLYLGGAEHATGHLLYVRFWTKYLFDIGKIPVSEPAKKLVNQGMIQGFAQYHLEVRVRADIKSNYDRRDKELHILKDGVVLHKFSIRGMTDSELPGHAIYCSHGSEKHFDIKFFDVEDQVYIPTSITEGYSTADFTEEVTINSTTYVRHQLKETWLRLEQHYNPIVITHIPVPAYWHYSDNRYNALDNTDVWMDFSGKRITSQPQPIWTCRSGVEKMSKSILNVVTPDNRRYDIKSQRQSDQDAAKQSKYWPLEESFVEIPGIIERYGADTLRLYEMFLGPLEQHKPWSTNGISGTHNFLKRFFRLFQKDDAVNVSNDAPTEAELKVLHRTLKKVADDIERMSFNTCVSTFMIAVNELYDLKCNKRAVLEPLVIALSPFAPHIAEELWNQLGNKGSVTQATFPKIEEKYLVDNTVNYPVQFNGKMRFTIALAADMSPKDIEKEVLASADAQKYLEGKTPKKVIVVPKKIVNVVL